MHKQPTGETAAESSAGIAVTSGVSDSRTEIKILTLCWLLPLLSLSDILGFSETELSEIISLNSEILISIVST